jgi:hypothetical protein
MADLAAGFADAPPSLGPRDGQLHHPQAGQPSSFGVAPQGQDPTLVRVTLLGALPGAKIPPAQLPIATPTHQSIPVFPPGHCMDNPLLPIQTPNAHPAPDIPNQHLPALASTSRRGQLCSMRAPGNTINRSVMSREPLHQPSGCRIPHINVAVITTAS